MPGLTAAPAIAKKDASDAANASADAKPAKEKKVCKLQEVTGSFMRKRICHTAEEWQAADAQNAKATEGIMNMPRSGGSTSPGKE